MLLISTENDESEETPLHKAARLAFPEILGQFLSNGGNPNTTTSLGETSLHAVCSSRSSGEERMDCLRVLLCSFYYVLFFGR